MRGSFGAKTRGSNTEDRMKRRIEVDDIDSVLSFWNYTGEVRAGLYYVLHYLPISSPLTNSTKVSQITSYHLALTWPARRSLPGVIIVPLRQEFKCLFRRIYLFDNKRALFPPRDRPVIFIYVSLASIWLGFVIEKSDNCSCRTTFASVSGLFDKFVSVSGKFVKAYKSKLSFFFFFVEELSKRYITPENLRFAKFYRFLSCRNFAREPLWK